MPFSEQRLFDGYPEPTNAPYGIAKRALLTYLGACQDQYGLRWSYPILANLYGPEDNFGAGAHCIPDIIQKIADAKERGHRSLTLWGDGTPTRDFLYVEDAAKAVVAASESPACVPVNCGTGVETSIFDLAHKLASLMGYKGSIEFDRTNPNGQLRRCLDTGNAEVVYGWTAETDIDAGLQKTVEWWQKSHSLQA